MEEEEEEEAKRRCSGMGWGGCSVLQMEQARWARGLSRVQVGQDQWSGGGICGVSGDGGRG